MNWQSHIYESAANVQWKQPEHCQRCGKGEPTEPWGDGLAVTHGFPQMWCKHCVARVQLRHALSRALRIPSLLYRALR